MDWLRLLFWLGPWSDQEKSPQKIEKEILPLENRFDLWIYNHPKRNLGTIFVIPGLHPEGPEDIRLDRFCRVLANSGMRVGVPSLPTMRDVVMSPAVLEDTKHAFQVFLDKTGEEKVGIFSISAASIAGFSLAVDLILSKRISFLHSFGGFSDWSEALLFALSGDINGGEETLEPDPLGMPVIFLNLVESFPNFFPEMRGRLVPKWQEFVAKTWERPEMQEESVFKEIALKLADGLEAEERTFFLKGCSVEEGGDQIVQTFLAKNNPIEWLEPEPLLKKIRVPTFLSHGRDDVVVPYTQIHDLESWLHSRYCSGVFITGFYHHTGVVGWKRVFENLVILPGELVHSIKMVRAIARTGGILK